MQNLILRVKIHPADTSVGVNIHPADPSPLPVSGRSAVYNILQLQRPHPNPFPPQQQCIHNSDNEYPLPTYWYQ